MVVLPKEVMSSNEEEDREAFEKQLRALLSQLEEEKEKISKRLITVQEALAAVERRQASIEETLRYYCEIHGIPFHPKELNEELRERFKDMSALDVMITLAKESGGAVVVKDVARILLSAGLYAHERSAQGSVYGMLDRHPELFVKDGPGRYQLRALGTEQGMGHGSVSPADLNLAAVSTHPESLMASIGGDAGAHILWR